MQLMTQETKRKIRQLEQALEQSLFKYAGKTLHILPAADALANSVQSIFGEVSSLQMELSEIAGTIRGELNLAAVSLAGELEQRGA